MLKKEIEKLDREFLNNTYTDVDWYDFWNYEKGMKGFLHRRDAKLLELVKGEIEKGRQKYLQLSGLGDHIFREITSVIDKIKEADNNPEQGKEEK
jgi:hypothetical protein